MNQRLKYNQVGYFKFFYGILGGKLIFNMFLGLGLSFLDGIGLAMFIPLLQFVDSSSSVDKNSMGGLSYILDTFQWFNLPVTIYSVLALMVLLFCVKGALNYWQLIEQVDLRQKFMLSVRKQQTNDLQYLSYKGFLKLDAGKIQGTLTTEVTRLVQAAIHYLGSFKAMIMLSGYAFLAFMANWQFAVFVAIGGSLTGLVFKRVYKQVEGNSIKVSHKSHIFNAYIIQAVHSFKYLKATNNFKVFATKLNNIIKEIEVVNRKIGASQALTMSTREPSIIIIVSFIILIQVRFFGNSIGSIMLSLLLFYRSLNLLIAVQTSWQNFMQNIGSLNAVEELSHAMKVDKEVYVDAAVPTIGSGLNLKDLTFSYGSNKVINNINISIPKNKTIALVGESGSGKTTVANLLTGLIIPDEGDILIDNKPLSEYNIDSYRDKIGYISQEAVIFTDNIFNNVTLWAERTPENVKRFWDVIEQTSLTSFIKGLREAEETQLGDNGMLVSGGQKQRISIARELFKNVELFIFDEATSALDSETERFIQDNIEKLQGSYTMVIIAHRLSTIKNADIIYLLEKGNVAAQGNFEMMLDQSPRFKRMVSLQEL